MTNGGQLPPLAPPSAPVQVSDDDVAHAIKSLGAAITVLKAKTKFKGLLDAARFASAMEVDNMLHHEPGSAAAHEDEAQAIEAATAAAADADGRRRRRRAALRRRAQVAGLGLFGNYDGSPGADRIWSGDGGRKYWVRSVSQETRRPQKNICHVDGTAHLRARPLTRAAR